MPILIKGGRRLYMNPVAYKLETGEAIKAPTPKPKGGRLLLHKGEIITGQEAESLTAALRKGKAALRKAVEKLTKAARVKVSGDTTPEARKNFRARAEFKQVLEAILPHITLVTLGCTALAMNKLGVPFGALEETTDDCYSGTIPRAAVFTSATVLSRAYDGDATADKRACSITTYGASQGESPVFGVVMVKDTWGRTMRLHELVQCTLENPRFLTEGASA